MLLDRTEPVLFSVFNIGTVSCRVCGGEGLVTNLTYLGSAGLGLALVAAGALLGFTDAGMEHGGDGAAETDVDLVGGEGAGAGVASGLSLLSVAGLGAVLFGFGAGGYVSSALGAPPLLAVPAGVAGAAGCFRLTAWLRRTLIRTLDTGAAFGETDFLFRAGTVTIPVPPGGTGRGQVLVQVEGRTFYLPAVTDADHELHVGEAVQITATNAGLYTVEADRSQ